MSPSKFSRLLAIFTLLLVYVAGCNSFSLTPTSTPHNPAGEGDNPTAGAIARSTRQAQATLDSRATATRQTALAAETAQAAANATQTAEAQAEATATVVARVTAQAIVTAKSAWPNQLSESFSDNQLGWPIGVTQDRFLAVNSTLAEGRYQWVVTVESGNSYFNLIPENGPVFADFYAEVALQFVRGEADDSAYGLAFRHVKDDYGFFGIMQSGRFRALEVHGTGIYHLIEESSPAIDTRPGRINRIAVAAVDSDFVFLINGQVVAQLSADITPGKIGLGVDAARKASEARVDFSDLKIYTP